MFPAAGAGPMCWLDFKIKSLDRHQAGNTYLLKVAEIFVFTQLVEVVDSLGIVETVVMVDFAVTS